LSYPPYARLFVGWRLRLTAGEQQQKITSTPVEAKGRAARRRILDAMRRELIGPFEGDDERFQREFPTSRYVAGRLAPIEERIDPAENDVLDAGQDDEEAGSSDANLPLVIGFHPSSMGISFVVGPEVEALEAEITWGDYKREDARAPEPSPEEDHEVTDSEESGYAWQRYPRRTLISELPLPSAGSIARVPLRQSAAPVGVKVTGDEDHDITLEGVVHRVGPAKAVSLFVVNRREKLPISDRRKDERWMLQARLEVRGIDNRPIFRARAAGAGLAEDSDEDARSFELIYRKAREYAAGHGVSADWDNADPESGLARRIWTEFIPEREIPSLIAPASRGAGAQLDMRMLSELEQGEEIFRVLVPLLEAYEAWIDQRRKERDDWGTAVGVTLKAIGDEHLERCNRAAERMRKGLELIRIDPVVAMAFRFANRAMWDQRIHNLWARENSRRGEVEGSAKDAKFDNPTNRTWRPFQMGFLLLCLAGISEPGGIGRQDRETVDLLWFPTGGGKTEAYLGLAALTIALRRLRGDQNGMAAGAGTSIIMRYTLRLVTVQQFQRATALLCACEVIRREDPKTWGDEPFRIGLWVGRRTTPNQYEGHGGARDALERLNDARLPREGSPVQLFSCPRCGSELADESNGRPHTGTYHPIDDSGRIVITCINPACEFTYRSSAGVGIPAVVVDDEIYRSCPSVIIATVDKFAQLPFKGVTQAIFGRRNRYSHRYGHLTEAHGNEVMGRRINDATAASPLLPPELIIQDELHLISGPLGTMVGLYETAVDRLCRRADALIPAKIITSTATIRRAPEQVRRLYARPVSIFPPSGLDASDSFFALEQQINLAEDNTAGRLYVGVNAPGSSTKTLLVRVYSILLAAAQAEIDADPSAADPYGTLVGYFNSLRALGGAKRLVEDDVRNVRLQFMARRRGLPGRRIEAQAWELTSRLSSWKIPSLLKRLERRFPREQGSWPIDTLLATNMISVGVDIDRLGLMVVTGQPRSTSEYIQATSRVGRRHPGLVVTMYNWLGVRDLSHYERFRAYHDALYRYVEAISATPFSSRAVDRGLRGVLVGMARQSMPGLAAEMGAQAFDPSARDFHEILAELESRSARVLESPSEGRDIREAAQAVGDKWAHYAEDPLRYSWPWERRDPPQNQRVLLKPTGSQGRGHWEAPSSLREVEPPAAFFLSEASSEPEAA
jgi:hypothetical protein